MGSRQLQYLAKKPEQIGMRQWGVSILIHTDMQQHIHQITRVNRRILTIATKSHAKSIPVTVATSYASHKGYKHEIRKMHWGTMGETIDGIPQNHLHIWRADANGQL